MNDEQQRISDYLSVHALGFENRKTSGVIRDACGLESGGATNEHVRFLIKDMILDHECLIGSKMWVDGYWVIQNEEELEMVCASHEQRADRMRARADALRESWESLHT